MPVSSSPSGPLIEPTAALELMQLARQAIEDWIERRPRPAAAVRHSDLEKVFGLFVTLRSAKTLRGCLGQVRPREPLGQLVRELAVASASHDPRFPPVTAREWPNLHLELSVLSAPQPMKHIGELEVGRHGVIVEQGSASGVYLPEVAVECGFGAGEFVRRCAVEKAGLSEKEIPQARVYLFTTQGIK